MKKSHHMILTLTLVGVFSSGALVGIYKYAQPLIKVNQRKALEEAIFQVLPEAKSFKTITKDGSMNPIGVLPVDWGGVVGGGDGVYTVKE